MAESPGAGLADWSVLCLRWFRDGSDPAAQAALTFFDQYCSPGGPHDSGEMPVQPEQVAALLRAAGLLGPSGLPIALTPERHTAYIAERNAARAEAHRQLQAARRARFEALLARYAPGAARQALQAEGDAPLLARGRFADIRPLAAAFVANHAGSLGVHPFFKGLRQLLQKQLGDPMVWRWAVQEEVFMEAGDDKFMEEAVQLLVKALQHVPHAVGLGDCESGGGSGSRFLVWEVAPHTSDRHIRRFLSLLPAEAKLEGRASGDLSKAETVRTNMSGELDEDGAQECRLSNFLPCSVL